MNLNGLCYLFLILYSTLIFHSLIPFFISSYPLLSFMHFCPLKLMSVFCFARWLESKRPWKMSKLQLRASTDYWWGFEIHFLFFSQSFSFFDFRSYVSSILPSKIIDEDFKLFFFQEWWKENHVMSFYFAFDADVLFAFFLQVAFSTHFLLFS